MCKRSILTFTLLITLGSNSLVHTDEVEVVPAIEVELVPLIEAGTRLVVKGIENSALPLRLYGESSTKAKTSNTPVAFRPDGATFAVPVDDEVVGVFQIKPEAKSEVVSLTDLQRQRVATLVRDLDSDDFRTRQDATTKLREIGASAEAALRQALKRAQSAEVQYRLSALLRQIEQAKSPAPATRLVQVARFRGLDANIRCIEYSPDRSKMLVAGYGFSMWIFDSRTHRQLQRILVADNVLHATFTPDGKRIIAATEEAVGIWDVETGVRAETSLTHTGKIY